MSISSSESAGVKGMIGRRQQRERRAVAVSRWETHGSVNLRGPLVDGEFGRLGRSSRWGLVVEMVQDASDDGGVDNEGEELHFSPGSAWAR